MKQRVKINGIIIFLSLVTIVVFPEWFLRSGREGLFSSEALEIIGITVILLGQLLRVSARGYKSEHSQSGRALVQGGPYSCVRNPMYLGVFLIALGIVMMLFNWWVVLLCAAFFGVQYKLLISKEEKKLQSLFPDAFPSYCNKVPRFMPSLRTIIDLDVVEYLPIRLKWFKGEIISICLLLFFVLLIESWKDIRQEGLRVYLQESKMIPVVLILFVLLVYVLSKHTEALRRDGTVERKNSV